MLNECERAKPNLVYILADDMGYGAKIGVKSRFMA